MWASVAVAVASSNNLALSFVVINNLLPLNLRLFSDVVTVLIFDWLPFLYFICYSC